MDDLISRQAAIDAIHCNIVITGRENAEIVAKTIGEFADRIKALPPVQPEPKEGEWSDGYWWQRCSLCKQTGKKSWNYCPKCGAKMKGAKD